MATRWDNNPSQGSAFHELVVLPTVAPQLARPYYIPGTPEYYAAEAAHRQEAVPAENPGSSLTCTHLISLMTIKVSPSPKVIPKDILMSPLLPQTVCNLYH